MAKKKETKQSPMQRLFVYAGKYKYLTIASWIFATISAFVALVPFYFIWRIIKEVLYVAPNYADAENLSAYGWSAVGFAILSMLIYIDVYKRQVNIFASHQSSGVRCVCTACYTAVCALRKTGIIGFFLFVWGGDFVFVYGNISEK